jgi:hypothetical protein
MTNLGIVRSSSKKEKNRWAEPGNRLGFGPVVVYGINFQFY